MKCNCLLFPLCGKWRRNERAMAKMNAENAPVRDKWNLQNVRMQQYAYAEDGKRMYSLLAGILTSKN